MRESSMQDGTDQADPAGEASGVPATVATEPGARGSLASDPEETVGLSARVVADAIAADWQGLASRLPIAPERSRQP